MKAMLNFDPVVNKLNRVEALGELEVQATDFANQGASPDDLNAFINQGRLNISMLYPDVPEYEKAASAAGLYKKTRAAADPNELLQSLPVPL